MNDANNAVSTMPKRAHHTPLAKVTNIGDAFEHPQFRERLAQGLPRHMSADRMLRVCTLSVQRVPKLMKCNPISLIGAFLTCSQLGLEPNTPLGHVYLIPFDVNKWDAQARQRVYIRTDVQVIIGYPGLIDLSYRSGMVTNFSAQVVWKGDEFSFSYGTRAHLDHRPLGAPRMEDQEPEWAYAHATLKDGQAFEVMPWRDVLMIRNQTQAYRTALAAREDAEKKGYKLPAAWTEAPWVKHKIPMGRKTAARQLSKWLPRSVELASAIALDEQQDRGTIDWASVVTEQTSVIDGGLALTDDSQDDGAPDPTFGLRERVVDGETGEVVHAGTGQQQSDAASASRQGFADTSAQMEQRQQQRRPRQERTAAPPPRQQEQRPAARREEPPVDHGGPPPGHPAWDESDPSLAGDAAHLGAVTQSQPPVGNQAPADPPAAEDEFQLVDEHGEPVGDAVNDPVDFARRYAYQLGDSKNPAAIIENNKDACDYAAMASAEARNIMADAEESLTKPAPSDDKPVDTSQRWVVQMPFNAQNKPHMPGFMSALKTMLGSVTNAEAMQAFIEANGDTIAKLPPLALNTAQTAISDRRATLGLSTVDGQPTQQQRPASGPTTDDAQAAADDRDAAWAEGVIRDDIGNARTLNELEGRLGNAALKTRVQRFERERPELHTRIKDAFVAKRDSFKTGGE